MTNNSESRSRTPRFPNGVPPMLPRYINGPATSVTEELGVKPKRRGESRKNEHIDKAQAELRAFEHVWENGSKSQK